MKLNRHLEQGQIDSNNKISDFLNIINANMEDKMNRKGSYFCLLLIHFGLSFLMAFGQVQIEWVKRYSPPAGGGGGQYLGIDAAGNIYVVGGYVTIKYDPFGNLIWERECYSPFMPFDMYVDSAGNVYITGECYSGPYTYLDMLTVKYDTDGNELWFQRYIGTDSSYARDRGEAVAVDNAGNVYVAGFANNKRTGTDWATIKYSPAGTLLWVREHHYTDSIDTDAARDITIDLSGNIIVTGYIDTNPDPGFGQYDFATIKYSSAGDILWISQYDGSSQDEALVIGTDNQQNVYVAGISFAGGYDWDYLTVKYDSLGTEQWIRSYDYQGFDDVPRALVVDRQNNIIVTGETNFANPYATSDYVTVKYDTRGNECWAVSYNGPVSGDDIPHSIAVDTFGYIYVTGESPGNTPPYYVDYLTIAYQPENGDAIWIARYDGGGGIEDIAWDVVCDHGLDDTIYVYVTGVSINPVSGDAEFCTIKYKYKAYPTGISEGTLHSKSCYLNSTIISGPLRLPVNKKWQVLDIAGREVDAHYLPAGIYFIVIDGSVQQKVVKIR